MALHKELKRQGDFLFRHRSYLPLVLLGAGLWVRVFHEKSFGPGSESLMSEMLEGAGLWIGLLGLAIRVVAVGYAPPNTSGRNTGQGQVADVLNTTGLYSMTRNPLYFGNYFMWTAVAMLTGSVWFVVVFSLAFWIYYERIVFAEEAFLRRKFGQAYDNWATVTPVFFPSGSNYVPPATRFCWKKVLKQEKNGFFALLFLFCLFGVVGDVAEGEVSLWEERYSIAGAVAAAVIYAILKMLKTWSSVLKSDG